MHEDELAWLGIEALHDEIQKDRLTVRELVDARLARIERLDPELRAYSVVWPERARAAADRLDRSRADGDPIGSLHGVTIALKDLCDVAGEPTRAGTTVLGDVPASANAEVVDRLEAAGAVVLGKVKMTEGAFVMHHASVTPPRNPWNPERWTGISSSGSGVAVAGGLATAALGTDTGGSIRYPSAACGVTGLKPTHGRVSLRGVYPLADSLDHIGPMARSVDDVARLFSVLSGYDAGDPWSRAANPPVASSSALLPRVRGTRIGVDRRYCEEDVQPVIAEAVAEAIEQLRALGGEIVEVELPSIEEAIASWLSLGSAEIANAHAETYPARKEEYGEDLAQVIELGSSVEGRAVAHAWKTRIAFSRRLEGLFDGIDALVAPVIPGRFAHDTNLSDAARYPNAAGAIRFTSPFNLSGSPSLTLPCGLDGDGAPIGFQLVGGQLDEARLLAIGTAYQSATDWHTMRPSLAAGA